MPKSPSLTDVTGTFADITVNNNSRKIENAFKNTISRDGSTPNQMGADLDLNNNDLLNSKVVFAQDVVIEELGSLGSILDQLSGGPEWASKEAPIANRSIASNTLIPNNIQTIVVRHNGKLLQYVRDPQGTALTTFGGDTWSPDASLPVWVEHWGAVGFNTPAEAVVDSTAAIQAGVLWQKGDLLLDGWYKITDGIDVNASCVLDCPAGRLAGGFRIDDSFNLNSPGVLFCSNASTGVEVGRLGFSFSQEAASSSGDRNHLVHYPPAINMSNWTRAIIREVQVQGGWDGIIGDGNCGGSRFGILELGCFNVNMRIDGALDFVHADSIEVWPYGISNNVNLRDIFYDGEGFALDLARCDGWNCNTFATYQQKVRLERPVGLGDGILPVSFGTLQLDGDGARLFLGRGRKLFGNIYSSKTTSPTSPSILVSAGETSVSNASLAGGETEGLKVTGGRLSISGGEIYNNSLSKQGAVVTGGLLSLQGVAFRWASSGSRSAPFISQDGEGRLILQGCFSSHTSPAETVVKTETTRNHFIDIRSLTPHKASFEGLSQGQYFTNVTSSTPTFSFDTPGNLSVAYSSRQFLWDLCGRVLRWKIHLVFTPTFSSSSGSCFLSLSDFPSVPVNEFPLAVVEGVSHQGSRLNFFIRSEANLGILRILEGGGDPFRNLSVSNFVSGQPVTILGNGSFWL